MPATDRMGGACADVHAMAAAPAHTIPDHRIRLTNPVMRRQYGGRKNVIIRPHSITATRNTSDAAATSLALRGASSCGPERADASELAPIEEGGVRSHQRQENDFEHEGVVVEVLIGRAGDEHHARDDADDESRDAPRQRGMQRARRDALGEAEHPKVEQPDRAGEQRERAKVQGLADRPDPAVVP